MFEQEFKADRNWAIIVGNTWTHHVDKNGDPYHMLPILKEIQKEAMKEGDRSQVAIELDYILKDKYPEKTDDTMEVYTHDWYYILDPNGDIRYSKCTAEKNIHIEFKNF